MEALAMHPTVKPLRLVADAMLDCSKRGGLILDGFAGSGTTIIAAEQTGRIACALELDPHYVDVAILRWEKLTGEPVRHEETGLTFADMARRGHHFPRRSSRLSGERRAPQWVRAPMALALMVWAMAGRRSTPDSSQDNPEIRKVGPKAQSI